MQGIGNRARATGLEKRALTDLHRAQHNANLTEIFRFNEERQVSLAAPNKFSSHDFELVSRLYTWTAQLRSFFRFFPFAAHPAGLVTVCSQLPKRTGIDIT
jgi:hypothetical protein